ncbi:MAG: hypothetical protein KAR06_12665, partial [Deltaproteobacteria bacterium]|nr:hypothetical protein [Deltaproteobacteria bacterium]
MVNRRRNILERCSINVLKHSKKFFIVLAIIALILIALSQIKIDVSSTANDIRATVQENLNGKVSFDKAYIRVLPSL